MTGGWYTADSTRERRGGGDDGGSGGGVGAGGGGADAVTVMEVEPWSGARTHSAQDAHSPRAPLVEEPEKEALVEAPGGAGTPAQTRCSVQVVAGPHVAR
jgi:hypothetical protein